MTDQDSHDHSLVPHAGGAFLASKALMERGNALADALDAEQAPDDPPERLKAWLSTISTTSLRALDLTLMIDLLRIEQDEARWGELMKPVVGLLEDLLLVGDFEAAIPLIGVLVSEAADRGRPIAIRQHAITALDVLIAGEMMRHIRMHLATIGEAQFERVKAMCISLGDVCGRRLAVPLSVEEHPRERHMRLWASESRSQLADELLHCFAASLRTAQRYSAGHPIIVRNLDMFSGALRQLHTLQSPVVVNVVGDEAIVDDMPMTRTNTLRLLTRWLQRSGVKRITIERGVEAHELSQLIDAMFIGTITAVEAAIPHVRVARVTVEPRAEDNLADKAAFKSLCGMPPNAMLDLLAQTVAQTRALPALKALNRHHRDTFIHTVNVSILTMGQAYALGMDGPLLAEFGLAALMHDIGKVRTPVEILNKADLTGAEFEIMTRHVVDGAEILRKTPDVPTLAPVVAFEHHLRLDGSGYPNGVKRSSLNLATMLCSIADVYDAMRSQSFPIDQILDVLRRKEHFDQHLVRRFIQLMGL